MSYRDLPGTLARIDAATDQTPTCARAACGTPAFSWLSPWCSPHCSRLSYAETRQRLAGLLAEVRQVREADATEPATLDDQDRTVLDRLCARGLTTDDIAPTQVSAWDLLGINPNATGEKSTAEHIDQIRNTAWSRDDESCSCHISPPCNWCTDPDNPLNLDEVDDGPRPADEPQPLVGAEHTIDVIDELYNTASEALEQRTAALGERAMAERKQRDRNRLTTAIRRWCRRG